MKIEDIEVYGFRKALNAMRNPMDSWDYGDSRTCRGQRFGNFCYKDYDIVALEEPEIGPRDLKLAKTLIKAGSSHRKFLRQIMVWCDLTAPRYLWQEIDTYKVGTVRVSCSTMLRLGYKGLSDKDFQDGNIMPGVLDKLRSLIFEYKSTKDEKFLREAKIHLPESFLQKSTYSFSYEAAIAMYSARKRHLLPEWSGEGGICELITRLPYMSDFLDLSVSNKQ